MKDYDRLITEQLNRLTALPTSRTKREKTIRAIAQAQVDGRSRSSVLGQNGVVSERIFYHSEKAYHGNDLFREVLEVVTDLYVERDRAEQDKVDQEARSKRHQRRAELLSDMYELGHQQLQMILDKISPTKPGQNPEFPKMDIRELTQLLKVTMEQERQEFNETAVQNVDLKTDGEQLPTAQVHLYIPENGRQVKKEEEQ